MTRTVGSLVRMYIEALSQLCQGFLALQRYQCYLRLEGWRVVRRDLLVMSVHIFAFESRAVHLAHCPRKRGRL